jgi:hypothetical protein
MSLTVIDTVCPPRNPVDKIELLEKQMTSRVLQYGTALSQRIISVIGAFLIVK